MTSTHHDQELSMALQRHQAGQVAEAEALYRRVIARDPRQSAALDLLGVLLGQSGRLDEGIDLIRRALKIAPRNPASHNNLGNLLKSAGKFDDAIAAFRRALSHKPDYAMAHNNLGIALSEKQLWTEALAAFREALRCNPDLHGIHSNIGNVLKAMGKSDDAIAAYRTAIALNPYDFEAQSNLGNVFSEKGELEHAIACYRAAIRVNPAFADAHFNLANLLKQQSQTSDAINSYREAIRIKPGYTDAFIALGNALRDSGDVEESLSLYTHALTLRPANPIAYNNLGLAFAIYGDMDQAIASYREAIRLKPDYLPAHNNLANAFNVTGKLDDALAALQQALALSPESPEVHTNMGAVLKDLGRIDEALACFRAAMKIKPSYPEAHSNLIYAMHFDPAAGTHTLAEELRRYREQYADPMRIHIRPFGNDRTPDRRLRVAYVSPDLREHVVARFLLPLLAAHNREQVEIACYADVLAPDAMTDRLRAATDQWRNIAGISDEQAAATIRNDKIDILIDLTMHTSRNRLLLFARKPAPVQVTWLAYPGSTGLDAIDYRLTDAFLEAPGSDIYSEKAALLPETYWCYQQNVRAPESVARVPSTGQVTFGCLNNCGKMSDPAIHLWGMILQAAPKSRLLLNGGAPAFRARVMDLVAPLNIDLARIEYLGKGNYFEAYQRIDIGLDPFPYVGATTTCDALWMGVPVITLEGRTGVGRSGVSILSNIGLPELIAKDEDDYLRRALTLAQNPARLAELRATLRDRMRASPLMDTPRFAKNIEAAYRQMWQNWCEQPS